MNETVLVAAIVALATLHVARRYLPRSWLRKPWPAAATPQASRVPSDSGCGTGCSSCNGCGAATLRAEFGESSDVPVISYPIELQDKDPN